MFAAGLDQLRLNRLLVVIEPLGVDGKRRIFFVKAVALSFPFAYAVA